MSGKEVFNKFPYEEYGERYLVSNQGKIWSNRAKRYLNSEISNKVEIVKINNLTGRRSTTFQVDKIVADAFLGQSDLFLEHIDGNILNNKVCNLRWTPIEEYLERIYSGAWREISAHHGYYVSDKGQIWSMKSKELRVLQNHGYLLATTIGYPNSKFYLVHQLVANEFIPNPDNLPFVSHISSDNLDNSVSNLKWVLHPKYTKPSIKSKEKLETRETESSESNEFCAELDWLPNYQIFEDGRVFSLHTKKFMTKSPNIKGYLRVACSINGTCKSIPIHRLVAEAWLPCENPEKMEVNHKNMIKTDNHVNNLEWVTPSENSIHAIQNNPERKKKSQIPIYCLDPNTDEIVQRYDGIMDASRDTEINSGSISKACKTGKIAGGYKWKHVNNCEP